HLIHSPGWQAKLLPDASVEVTTPDGRVLTSHPPPRGIAEVALRGRRRGASPRSLKFGKVPG
ncbi:MAG: hypothetical protein M3507_03215, partial [Actinomycetota bacterium]|nr:hypothetical protein [Actinomycetota bacterium]